MAKKKKKLTKDDFFVPANHVLEEDEVHLSPSGKYQLTIQSYDTSKVSGESSWGYTAGVVAEVATGKQIAEVRRNYRSFWHLWLVQAEKEYLLCGEDYQGYGYVDLQTGKSEFHLSDAVEKGNGFCVVKAKQTAPDRLMVEGCIWACPFEVHTYDVSDPTTLPYPLVERRDSAGDADPDFNGREESLASEENGESNRQFFFEEEHRHRQSALVIVKDALRRHLNDEHIYACQQHQEEHDLQPEDMHCNCKQVIVDYALNAAVLLAHNLPLMPSIFSDAKYYTHAESGEDHDEPLTIEGQKELDDELIREVYRSSRHSQPIEWKSNGSE